MTSLLHKKIGSKKSPIKLLRAMLRKKVSSANNSDWVKEKEKWIKAVGCFYQSIENMLKDTGVLVGYSKNKISDVKFGTYEVPEMTLYVGREVVNFQPLEFARCNSTPELRICSTLGDTDVLFVDGAWRSSFPWLYGIEDFDASVFLKIIKDIMV